MQTINLLTRHFEMRLGFEEGSSSLTYAQANVFSSCTFVHIRNIKYTVVYRATLWQGAMVASFPI